MDRNNYIVAIDLGSSNIAIAAGNKDLDGKLNIIDASVKPIKGMSASEVTNIEQVTATAREAVNQIETDLGIKIDKAYVGISGKDIKCADSSYFVYVTGEDGEIREEDVVKLHESMDNLQPPEGVSILDRIPQNYLIDSEEVTMQPVGRFGHKLEATFNFVVGNKNSLDRFGKAFSRLGIRQAKLYTDAQASAAAVLTEDEKELGVAVVDIGAGCTDICIWQDNIMRYIGVIPIGSEAVTQDIRSMAIPERLVEKIKQNHGFAVANRIPEEIKGQSIKIKGRTPRETKEISFYNLSQIIEARLTDIIEYIMYEIKDSGYADKLGAGIVLTGGGALLNDIDTLFREKTKYDVRIGSAYHNLLNEDSIKISEDLKLTTVIGLLLMGMEDGKITPSSPPITKNGRSQEEDSEKGHENRNANEVTPDKKESKSKKKEKGGGDKNSVKPEEKKKKLKGLRKILDDIFQVVDDQEI